MVPTGSHQRPQGPPLIYVTRFASHRGGVWQLRGPRGLRHQGPGLGACSVVERAAVESGPPGRELPTGTQARVAAIPDSTSFQLRKSRAPTTPRGLERAARAGLKQKTAAKEFDFPIPLDESSKTTKEMRKVLAWKKVSKVICRMIAENENYRHRLKCQNLSSELQLNHFVIFQQPWLCGCMFLLPEEHGIPKMGSEEFSPRKEHGFPLGSSHSLLGNIHYGFDS